MGVRVWHYLGMALILMVLQPSQGTLWTHHWGATLLETNWESSNTSRLEADSFLAKIQGKTISQRRLAAFHSLHS